MNTKLLCAALGLSLPGAALAQITPAQTFTATAGSTWATSFSLDRTIGWEFELAQDKEITAIGVYDRGAPSPEPGLGVMHEAAIWDTAQNLMAMTTVPAGAGGSLVGGFRYQNITPVTLTGAPTNYKVAALWRMTPFDHYPDLNASGIMPTYHPDITFVQSAQAFGSTFAYPVVNSGNTFLSGAVNFLLNDSGQTGPIGTSYCGPAIPNSSGNAGAIAASGVAVAGGLPLNLAASGLPANQFGFFLGGQTQGFFNPPNSQGFICLSGQIGRFNRPGEIMNSGAGGAFDLDVDTNSIPVSPTAPILAGETWNFQAWFRDNNPTLTSNFTDGVSILFQ